MSAARLAAFSATGLLAVTAVSLAFSAAATPDVERLVAALLGETPLVDDLGALTDRIGGRPTGSEANRRAIDWALARFRDAGVEAQAEPFTMPAAWLERSAQATIEGEGVRFRPRVAAMPFSAGTGPSGTTAPLVDGGRGGDADFARLADTARGAFVLIETDELKDVDGLFREYAEAAQIEERAAKAGVTGVVYQGSRPNNTLYRHNVAAGEHNARPMLVVERDGASRAFRLLREGTPLALTARLELDAGPPYESRTPIGEIRGASRPEEVVIVGAHLDSWDLGTGALDNGANVALVIDIARQIRRLGIHPARTIRFALWNGEEQGMQGSRGYTTSHAAELDHHVAAGSIDIGCGRITGFFTGGRPEMLAAIEQVLGPVDGLGPFVHVDAPIVGTDNYDFMMQGIANFVANQQPAAYGPNYHARSDTMDKCDTRDLRVNAAIMAAVVLGLADGDMRFPRQSRADIERLIQGTDLKQQMQMFANLWADWEAGRRGRTP